MTTEETTAGVQFPAGPYLAAISTRLPRSLSITWELVAVALVTVAAAASRLWDLGARVMSHDESLHTYYSWRLATGQGFAHNPMMHGPFLFEATALVNWLFGASDSTSRLVPALLGTFVVAGVPQFLRPWLGRAGALATSLLLLISPFVLYYSRYIRHDVQVIAWMLLAIAAMLRYVQTRGMGSLLCLAAALALMFATMETTFIYLAIFASFWLLRLVSLYRRRWQSVRQTPEFDLLVVLATLGAFFSSPIALLGLNPIWARLTGQPFVDLQALGVQGLEWASGPTVWRLWGLLGAFGLGAAAVGVWWGGRRWLQLAAVFGAIVVPLYTTFFTNWAGLGTGLVGSLGYWLSQQGVARGGQPGYYYLLVFPLYEYLPLAGGLAASAWFVLRRRALSPEARLLVPFTAWWAGLIWLGLSLAGEKMPWLSIHITIPFVLLTGWWVGQLWHWRHPVRRALALGSLSVLALATLRTSVLANYVNYDYTTEPIGYAHGAPGVKWVMEDLAEIAEHTGAGRNLKVAYDDEVAWPLTWYLRDFAQQAYYGDSPTREALDAPVVIAGAKHWPQVEALLGTRYQRYEVIRMWWPIEDYKNLTADRLKAVIADPAWRSAVWAIVWNRDYTQYAQLSDQAIDPPETWPLSDRMRIYLRADVADHARQLAASAVRLPDIADAYAALRQAVAPAQTIAGVGLGQPRALAQAPDGTIYVADSGNQRMVRLDAQGRLVQSWGTQTPADQASAAAGTFNEPWGVALDREGNVYVADTWNHRIQKFDAAGNFVAAWGEAGLASDGLDRFWGPRGIAVDAAGRVYVTDTGNKRVVVFDQAGKPLYAFGTQVEAALNEPVGIAVGPDGRVYVADTWNGRVAVFSAEGALERAWPVQAWSSTSLDNKPHLAVDSQGRVAVTDPEAGRVIVFDAAGTALSVLGTGSGDGTTLGRPAGIAAAAGGGFWISDAATGAVALYRP